MNDIQVAGSELLDNLEIDDESVVSISAAFETYQASVLTALSEDSEFSATALATIDNDINEQSGSKLQLELALSEATNSESVFNAYIAFFEAIETAVDIHFNDNNGTNADAITETMILLNCAS